MFRKSISEGPAQWWLPVGFAFLVLLTAAPLVWSRDFAFFLLRIPYAIILALACVMLFVSGLFLKDRVSRLVRFEAAFAGLAVFALICALDRPASDFFHDRVGFWLWYPAHQDLISSSRHKDGIIATWDDWGMAGMSFDAFLVSDPDDTIGDSADRASAWTRRLKSDCDVAYATRLERGIYILGTYNCPLTDERQKQPRQATFTPLPSPLGILR